MARIDHYKRVPVVGLLIGIVTLGILATKPAGFSLIEISALLALCGLGLGTMYPLTTVIMQNVVLPHQMGTATGMLNFFRLLGGAFIVAGFGAIVLGSVDGGQVLNLDRLAHATQNSAADFAQVFRRVFVAAAACIGLALAAIAIMPERPLRGPARAALTAEET
jgi:MFS family permease